MVPVHLDSVSVLQSRSTGPCENTGPLKMGLRYMWQLLLLDDQSSWLLKRMLMQFHQGQPRMKFEDKIKKQTLRPYIYTHLYLMLLGFKSPA